jgi:hypothetical protein
MDDTTKKSIFDETDEEEKSSWPFDNLPKDIRDWLRSLTVQNEIDRINRQFADPALDEQGISSVLAKLVLGKIRANQFISTLISEHSATPRDCVPRSTKSPSSTVVLARGEASSSSSSAPY